VELLVEAAMPRNNLPDSGATVFSRIQLVELREALGASFAEVRPALEVAVRCYRAVPHPEIVKRLALDDASHWQAVQVGKLADATLSAMRSLDRNNHNDLRLAVMQWGYQADALTRDQTPKQQGIAAESHIASIVKSLQELSAVAKVWGGAHAPRPRRSRPSSQRLPGLAWGRDALEDLIAFTLVEHGIRLTKARRGTLARVLTTSLEAARHSAPGDLFHILERLSNHLLLRRWFRNGPDTPRVIRIHQGR
jgi:hypothetical protein